MIDLRPLLDAVRDARAQAGGCRCLDCSECYTVIKAERALTEALLEQPALLDAIDVAAKILAAFDGISTMLDEHASLGAQMHLPDQCERMDAQAVRIVRALHVARVSTLFAALKSSSAAAPAPMAEPEGAPAMSKEREVLLKLGETREARAKAARAHTEASDLYDHDVGTRDAFLTTKDAQARAIEAWGRVNGDVCALADKLWKEHQGG